jgi:AcrR family transcriptional regulator
VTRVDDATAARRRYDSPVRRQRAAETRDRIVAAAVELLHGTASWNWRAVTVRAVAQRAGVNERTVYRHFDNERALRDAVLARIEDEVAVEPESFTLDNLPAATARIYEYVSSFPIRKRPPRDATVEGITERQRAGLHSAVTQAVPDWDGRDQAVAAAMLDLLLGVASYERLVVDWGLEPADAVAGITWAMDLVEAAIREGRRPGRGAS